MPGSPERPHRNMEASFGEYIGRLVGFLCRWPVAGIQHDWKKEEEKKKKKYVKLLKYSNRTFFLSLLSVNEFHVRCHYLSISS